MIFKRVAAGLLAALLLPAGAAMAEVKLRYSNWLPPTHPFMEKIVHPWIKSVEEVTEGRVKIEILPKVVGTVPTQFEVVRDGLADVSFIVDGYSVGRFELGGIVELPFLGSSSRATSIAYWRIYQKHLKQFGEFEGVVNVGTGSSGPSALLTSKGPIERWEQVEGLKLRTPTVSGSKIIDALGGVPVNKPISEMHELISTGIVDGMLAPPETIRGFKLADHINHVYTVEGGFSGATISLIVNENSLNSIPEDDLKLFWSVSGEVIANSIANAYEEVNAGGKEDVIANGGTVTEATPEMVEQLKEKLAFADQAWIEKARGRGMENAEAVLEEFRAEIKALEAELASN